jgi:hypothetical protein
VSLIAVMSAKGSPGVSTLVMELLRRWPREVVGIELDPSGGSWALRHEGMSWDPGVVSLASTPGAMHIDFAAEHGSPVGRHGVAICASPVGEQMRASLDVLEPRLIAWPDQLDGIIDVGRYDPALLRVLSRCLVTLVVSRTRPEDVGQLQRLADILHREDVTARLVLIGSEAPFYEANEIAQAVRLPRVDVDIPFATGKKNKAYERSLDVLTDVVSSHCAAASSVRSETLDRYSASLIASDPDGSA